MTIDREYLKLMMLSVLFVGTNLPLSCDGSPADDLLVATDQFGEIAGYTVYYAIRKEDGEGFTTSPIIICPHGYLKNLGTSSLSLTLPIALYTEVQTLENDSIVQYLLFNDKSRYYFGGGKGSIYYVSRNDSLPVLIGRIDGSNTRRDLQLSAIEAQLITSLQSYRDSINKIDSGDSK